MTGTSLPITGVTVSFGGASCVDSTPSSAFTETAISCTLKHAPRAGDHKAEIRDSRGLVNFASGVADINIALTVTSVNPPLANALGGDTLTINGTGFPVDSSAVLVTLKTANDESACKVKTSTETQITCLIEKMTTNDGSSRTISINVLNPRYINRRRDLQTHTQTTNTS